MIDLDLFKNIMNEARNNPDLLDSFSPNQFKSKENLINHIKKLNILKKNNMSFHLTDLISKRFFFTSGRKAA